MPSPYESEMRPSDYRHVKEVVLQVLPDYEDGISIERLARKVSELVPHSEAPRLSEVRDHVKRARIELEAGGFIEHVPDTNPAEFRLPVKGREAFVGAARRGHVAVLTRLLVEAVEQETKDAALISAVINDRLEAVRLLLNAGANVHARDSLFSKDALMYVTDRTSGQIVRLLERASNSCMQRTR